MNPVAIGEFLGAIAISLGLAAVWPLLTCAIPLLRRRPRVSYGVGKQRIALVSVVMGSFVATSALANLVADPSFELNDGSWTAQLMTIGSFGADNAHSGISSAAGGCIGHDCVSTVGAGAFIGQTLATTAGQGYDLSFWVAENGGPTSEMSVFWNGNLIADILNPANNTIPPGSNFIQFSFKSLLATGSSTVLEVHGRQDPSTIFFDDFSVTPSSAPEPGSLAIVSLGLAALGFVRRKRETGRPAPARR